MTEQPNHVWEDPAFLAQAVAWVDERLADLGRERTGDVEQPHVRSWATVLRVPTADGPVWFKANTEALRHEVLVVDKVSSRVPARVPALLGRDLERGWMLMADAGERLREVVVEEQSLGRWHDILEGAADLHHALEPDVDELVAAGLPDLRLADLADRYADLVAQEWVEPRFREAVPLVHDLVDELASYGVVETLQHDDLHDGQVFLGAGVHQVLDWGDACVSHPFFTLAVTLEGVIAWGVDDEEGSEDLEPHLAAYLRPYAERYPLTDAELREAARVAMRLGWVCRAINGALPQDPGQTHTRLSMFLDAKP